MYLKAIIHTKFSKSYKICCQLNPDNLGSSHLRSSYSPNCLGVTPSPPPEVNNTATNGTCSSEKGCEVDAHEAAVKYSQDRKYIFIIVNLWRITGFNLQKK